MIKNIRVINKNPYKDMKRRALKTMGFSIRKDDTWDEEWVNKSIISRHSHIRCVFIEIEFETTKAVRDQILRSRHGYAEPYVQSSRPDRTGKPREATATSTWIHDFNIEGLLKFAGDRLCTSTEGNTRLEIHNLKKSMMKSDDNIIRVVGEMLSPKCAWYGDCNEFRPKDCFDMVENKWSILERIGIYTTRHMGV